MPRISSLDVGSNTVRLLVAERLSPRKFRPVRVERIISRLGGGFRNSGDLEESAMERTAEAIRALADISRQEGAKEIFAVGTGVLRKAKNQQVFLSRVKARARVTLRVVSGAEEARLMLRGVLWSLKRRGGNRLVADAGGWSTEILWVEKKVPRETASLELGVVGLTERFLKGDPPGSAELEAVRREIAGRLGEVRQSWEKAGKEIRQLHPHLVGTAGTATTLAAIDLGLTAYDPAKINGHVIPVEGLTALYERLRSLPLSQRLAIPGLEKGREDLIVPGALIFLGILDVFELKALEVIDSGLLEGILIECGLQNAECGT